MRAYLSYLKSTKKRDKFLMLNEIQIASMLEFLKERKVLLQENKLDQIFKEARAVCDTSTGMSWDIWDLSRFIIDRFELNNTLKYMTNIPGYWIAGDLDITEISLPSNIYQIGRWAFDECKNLRSVYFDNTGLIRKRAFSKCGLESIYLPASLDIIYDRAFAFNPLKQVIFDKNCNATISPNIFEDCPIEEIQCNEEIYKQLPPEYEKKVVLY